MRDPAEPNRTSRPRQFLSWSRKHLRKRRERLHGRPALTAAYRAVVGVVGGALVGVGIVMIPYPGPGWLVVFAGLGVLATEFVWAHRVNRFAMDTYQRWAAWLRRQHWGTRVGFAVVTGVVVLVTIWLTGVIGLLSGWLDLDWDWLRSPLSAASGRQ